MLPSVCAYSDLKINVLSSDTDSMLLRSPGLLLLFTFGLSKKGGYNNNTHVVIGVGNG
jgi:hypothetical protein